MIGPGGARTGRFRTCASAPPGGVRKEAEGAAYNAADVSTLFVKGPYVQPTPAIFKAYDIRGIVPSTLNEEVALGLGRAFGTAARAEGQTTVAVGRDGRLSGPVMSAALIQGLVEAGIEVIDVGLVTTPLLYFAASTLCASGIQVTGSHNPKDYNGFKMVLAAK